MPVFIICFLFSSTSFAFLDFIGNQTKEALEVAAYVDATAELIGEISPDGELSEGAKDVKKRSEQLRTETSKARTISRTTKAVLNGPDWSSKRLETNIRNTTDYVRKLKRLIGRVAALGTNGAIALNTTETNVALNEVQKNQQAMILQNEESKIRELEREQEEAHQWANFSEHQRKLRKSEGSSGKL